MRLSRLSILVDRKSDPSMSKVDQQANLYGQQALLRRNDVLKLSGGVYKMHNVWIDTHLLKKKLGATYGSKDDPVSSHTQDGLKPKISYKSFF